ncbi:MAG: hypothetical protein NTV86_21865 [Planctomycetota bacterium]|nr:hypothetical protein [Planctomycetota bacterium]
MGEPPEMPLAFVAWPDSLIFVAAQVCEDGPDRDKVTENLRRQLYRPEKERVGRPESMPGGPAPGAPTSRSAESGQGGVFERQFFQTEDEPLGPGQSHTYRVVLPLPYRVQDMFKNPFAAREKSDLNEAGWIFDGREDVEETLPARATRVWLGVCYYLGDPDVDEGSGKREQALCRMLITKSLKEGQQFRWENTGFGAILDVTIRYATSEPLEIAVPLKVERWQYLGPDMPADPNSDSPADDADESPGTHEKDASKEMKESKGP